MLAAGGPGAEDDDWRERRRPIAGSLAGGCWDVRDAPGPRDAGSQDADGQDCGPAGFGSGQPLDVLRPGPVLAGEADRAHTGALRAVSDDELTGMIKAWRRLSSWATARELSAIAEFARRRPEEDTESDFARHARARRAASGPPQAATQASSAQTAQTGGALPAAQAAPADATAGAHPAAQAPAASAGGADGASPAGQAGAAAPAGGANPSAQAAPAAAATSAGGANPAGQAEACGGGQPAAGPGFPEVISAFASYELSLALTLTGRSAEAYLDFSVELATKLPKTMAALEAGQIDIIRARIIAEATHVLSNEHTAAVEDRIFPAPGSRPAGSCGRRWPARSLPPTPGRREPAGKRRSVTRGCCAGVKTPAPPRCAAVICRRRTCWPPISGSRRGRVT